MLQMKEQGEKTKQNMQDQMKSKQANYLKIIQSNVSKDDPRSWKQNGGID